MGSSAEAGQEVVETEKEDRGEKCADFIYMGFPSKTFDPHPMLGKSRPVLNDDQLLSKTSESGVVMLVCYYHHV